MTVYAITVSQSKRTSFESHVGAAQHISGKQSKKTALTGANAYTFTKGSGSIFRNCRYHLSALFSAAQEERNLAGGIHGGVFC